MTDKRHAIFDNPTLLRFPQELTKQKPVEECCKGYTETTNGDRCIPICSQDCRHGTCIAPDVCKCESGYGGPLCDFSKCRILLLLPPLPSPLLRSHVTKRARRARPDQWQ